jgi:hypothetical protein
MQDEEVSLSDFDLSVNGMNHLIKQVPDNCALFLPEMLVRSTDIRGTQSQGKQFIVSTQVLGEGIRTLTRGKKTMDAQKRIPPPGRPHWFT